LRGFRAEGIHGDLTQGKRESVLKQFKNERIEVLVATDVAARGLDITGVTHVYNFDIPQDPESYVHRIGRTGRAGRKGEAISFITPREIGHLHVIEKLIKSKIQRMMPPSNKEAQRGQQKVTVEKLLKRIKKKNLEAYHEAANELLDDHDSITVISAALSMLTQERTAAPVKLSGIQPIGVNKRGGGNRRKGGRRPNNKRFQGQR